MHAIKILHCQGGRVVTRLHIALGVRLQYFSILYYQTKKGGGAETCSMAPYSTRLRKGLGLQQSRPRKGVGLRHQSKEDCRTTQYILPDKRKEVGLQDYISDQGRRWGCKIIYQIKEGDGAATYLTSRKEVGLHIIV